jgi:hypothetical protein
MPVFSEGQRQVLIGKCKPGAAVATPGWAGAATGNCYENAANAVLPIFGTHEGWTLVHGRPTLTRPPYVQFGHAWLEKGKKVHDPSSNTTLPKIAYYAMGNISKEHNLRYSGELVRQYLLLTEHYGPWEGVDGTPPTAQQKRDWKMRGKKLPRKGRKG